MESTEMSKLNRKQLKRLLLKEFKMLGMGSPEVGMLGHSPFPSAHDDYGHDDYGHDDMKMISVGHKGGVSKEDCCKAVLCLIECCNCPETKSLLQECCEDILSRC